MSWEQRCFVSERISSGVWWEARESVSPESDGVASNLEGIMGVGEKNVRAKTLTLQSALTPIVSAFTMRTKDGREVKLEVRDLGTYFYVSGSGLKFYANEKVSPPPRERSERTKGRERSDRNKALAAAARRRPPSFVRAERAGPAGERKQELELPNDLPSSARPKRARAAFLSSARPKKSQSCPTTFLSSARPQKS
jgi:hypothetical protein